MERVEVKNCDLCKLGPMLNDPKCWDCVQSYIHLPDHFKRK